MPTPHERHWAQKSRALSRLHNLKCCTDQRFPSPSPWEGRAKRGEGDPLRKRDHRKSDIDDCELQTGWLSTGQSPRQAFGFGFLRSAANRFPDRSGCQLTHRP
ncbi:hypothetical protein RB12830 [Rhodopirellula baltica SH 1]|uniref:Uncharacterized protein n=1 Tax=Rhodopirellula baltica (strain DSM 10527 / NCIMB 13988 / SH1) TaxID=243090 RepID=Q7UI08_RHOBA|nr:hypothetical protein RB12830 [Rhodopirellula baltica SH 1]